MKNALPYVIAMLAFLSMQTGCTVPMRNDPHATGIDGTNLPPPNFTASIEGLSTCTSTSDAAIHLNSKHPVNIIVHGCEGSAARFRSLAQVFAFHGQQTVCFSYNDRDSLMKCSAYLIDALIVLASKLESPRITVIGHSQGGLISRKALIANRNDKFSHRLTSLRLVTISAPFAGIAAADHCASSTARVLSLGLVIPICYMISGDKWYEITHPSDFIQKPGRLLDQVSTHVKIVTDEIDTCRKFDHKNSCVEDDFVFSVSEQYFDPVDSSIRVDNIELSAGHVEIVGDHRIAPRKLIKVLQAKGIMHGTDPGKQEELSELLSQLYF